MTPIKVTIQAAIGPVPPWRAHASCAKVYVPQLGGANDPWFPAKGASNTKETPYLAAKQICSRCPVRAACLADALASNDRWGIRGGLSPRERQHLRAQQS